MKRFPLQTAVAMMLPLAVLCTATSPSSASVSVYMTPEHLAQRSVLVVEAVVVRTASGFDPTTRALSTYITLRVETVHRGPGDLERIVLREPGGRFGTLVHDVDAVPIYEPGERVYAFLEPGAGGVLRTTGMFFGKYSVDGSIAGEHSLATRDLDGSGRIFGRPGPLVETIRLRELIGVTAAVDPEVGGRPVNDARATRPAVIHPTPTAGNTPTPDRTLRGQLPEIRERAWTATPPEMPRLLWDEVRQPPPPLEAAGPSSGAAGSVGPVGEAATQRPDFAPLSASNPTRWTQADSGSPVSIHIERDGNPLNDGGAAVAEMQRAMDAWTDVPEARITLQTGNDDYDYTGSHAAGPASVYSGTNVILFDDPYGDITDPTGCSGVLAIGGYWRSGSTGAPVNGVSFHPALQLYVIFNNNFDCFLGDRDNLAEVATHEIGHGIGFGHSTTFDAIMRSSAYGGGRGPRLGDDDRDATHCHYPHTVTLDRPDGGESFDVGAVESIQWSASAEDGPDPGDLDLEYSTDGGGVWKPIVASEANDGHYDWLVPDDVTDDAVVRVVRPNRAGAEPPLVPTACSADGSDANFTIAAATTVPGSVDAPSGALRIEPAAGGDLRLSWSGSCSTSADDYSVYEGTLAVLRAGNWDHAPLTCSAGPDLVEHITPGPGSRYYLVAPSAGLSEGTLGTTSAGPLRPPSDVACRPREATPCS